MNYNYIIFTLNDAKCKQLGWRCIPLVLETYGAWGAEAIEVFSTALYGRRSMILVRANAGAIVTCMRSYLPSSVFNDIILDL